MKLPTERSRISKLLKKTILHLCHNELTFKSMSISATIGITLDEDNVFLVDIRKKLKKTDCFKEADSEDEVPKDEDYSCLNGHVSLLNGHVSQEQPDKKSGKETRIYNPRVQVPEEKRDVVDQHKLSEEGHAPDYSRMNGHVSTEQTEKKGPISGKTKLVRNNHKSIHIKQCSVSHGITGTKGNRLQEAKPLKIIKLPQNQQALKTGNHREPNTFQPQKIIKRRNKQPVRVLMKSRAPTDKPGNEITLQQEEYSQTHPHAPFVCNEHQDQKDISPCGQVSGPPVSSSGPQSQHQQNETPGVPVNNPPISSSEPQIQPKDEGFVLSSDIKEPCDNPSLQNPVQGIDCTTRSMSFPIRKREEFITIPKQRPCWDQYSDEMTVQRSLIDFEPVAISLDRQPQQKSIQFASPKGLFSHALEHTGMTNPQNDPCVTSTNQEQSIENIQNMQNERTSTPAPLTSRPKQGQEENEPYPHEISMLELVNGCINKVFKSPDQNIVEEYPANVDNPEAKRLINDIEVEGPSGGFDDIEAKEYQALLNSATVMEGIRQSSTAAVAQALCDLCTKQQPREMSKVPVDPIKHKKPDLSKGEANAIETASSDKDTASRPSRSKDGDREIEATSFDDPEANDVGEESRPGDMANSESATSRSKVDVEAEVFANKGKADALSGKAATRRQWRERRSQLADLCPSKVLLMSPYKENKRLCDYLTYNRDEAIAARAELMYPSDSEGSFDSIKAEAAVRLFDSVNEEDGERLDESVNAEEIEGADENENTDDSEGFNDCVSMEIVEGSGEKLVKYMEVEGPTGVFDAMKEKEYQVLLNSAKAKGSVRQSSTDAIAQALGDLCTKQQPREMSKVPADPVKRCSIPVNGEESLIGNCANDKEKDGQSSSSAGINEAAAMMYESKDHDSDTTGASTSENVAEKKEVKFAEGSGETEHQTNSKKSTAKDCQGFEYYLLHKMNEKHESLPEYSEVIGTFDSSSDGSACSYGFSNDNEWLLACSESDASEDYEETDSTGKDHGTSISQTSANNDEDNDKVAISSVVKQNETAQMSLACDKVRDDKTEKSKSQTSAPRPATRPAAGFVCYFCPTSHVIYTMDDFITHQIETASKKYVLLSETGDDKAPVTTSVNETNSSKLDSQNSRKDETVPAMSLAEVKSMQSGKVSDKCVEAVSRVESSQASSQHGGEECDSSVTYDEINAYLEFVETPSGSLKDKEPRSPTEKVETGSQVSVRKEKDLLTDKCEETGKHTGHEKTGAHACGHTETAVSTEKECTSSLDKNDTVKLIFSRKDADSLIVYGEGIDLQKHDKESRPSDTHIANNKEPPSRNDTDETSSWMDNGKTMDFLRIDVTDIDSGISASDSSRPGSARHEKSAALEKCSSVEADALMKESEKEDQTKDGIRYYKIGQTLNTGFLGVEKQIGRGKTDPHTSSGVNKGAPTKARRKKNQTKEHKSLAEVLEKIDMNFERLERKARSSLDQEFAGCHSKVDEQVKMAPKSVTKGRSTSLKQVKFDGSADDVRQAKSSFNKEQITIAPTKQEKSEAKEQIMSSSNKKTRLQKRPPRLDSKTPGYVCYVCGEVLWDRIILHQHLNLDHVVGAGFHGKQDYAVVPSPSKAFCLPPWFPCEPLKSTDQFYAEQSASVYTCNFCNLLFKKVFDFTDHIVTEHLSYFIRYPGELKLCYCGHCPKVFSCLQVLRIHDCLEEKDAQAPGTKQKRYKAMISKQADTKAELSEPMISRKKNIYTHYRNFNCMPEKQVDWNIPPILEPRTKSRSVKLTPPLACNMCSQTCRDVNDLYKHRKSHCKSQMLSV